MFSVSKVRIILVLAAVLLAVLAALPNVLPQDVRSSLPDFVPSSPVVLGLDLQGGSHMLLEVDRESLKQELARQLRGDIRQTLFTENKIKHSIGRGPGGELVIRILEPEKVDEALRLVRELSQPVQTGFLGQGREVSELEVERQGDRIILGYSDTGLEQRISRAVEQSISIIEQRVNPEGTLEPTIQRQGADRILIQIPGLQDPAEVKRRVGQTAKLSFRLLCEAQPGGGAERPPIGCEAIPDRLNEQQDYWVQTSRRATVEGEDLNDAQPGFDQRNGEPIVSFRFNQKGALRFGKLTQANVGRPFAIVLDQRVVSAPVIQEPILGGTGQISGRFTVEEANDLAIVLRSGALPAKLTIVEERTVGPSLGSDSIRAGILACIVGLAGVLVFMVIAYGTFGIFANIALLANLFMLIGILSLLQATLTLPGIAGIVLTLGMAVDSNVLIFERIREEVRNGRTPLNALETGFSRALATVLDANITTLIAAMVLYGLGSGPIRGFAVTLGIGIATTVFTAYTLTRLIVALWVRQTRPKEVPL